MVICMKITLNLDNEILRRAKQEAAAQGSTLTSLVEDALRRRLAQSPPTDSFRLDFPVTAGRRPPAVDPADRAALEDRMAQSS